MVPEPNFVNCDMVKTFLGKYPDDKSALLNKSRVDKLNKSGCGELQDKVIQNKKSHLHSMQIALAGWTVSASLRLLDL